MTVLDIGSRVRITDKVGTLSNAATILFKVITGRPDNDFLRPLFDQVGTVADYNPATLLYTIDLDEKPEPMSQQQLVYLEELELLQ